MDLAARPIAPDPYDMLPRVPSFPVTSIDFSDHGPIPIRHSGEGEHLSPGLSWSGFPPETRSFLISCFDPDAPTPAGFWHWTVVNLDPTVTELLPGAGSRDDLLPPGAFHLGNDGGGLSYTGPMPPRGDRAHRYYFAVHALDIDDLGLDSSATPTRAAFTILGHTIARGVLVGTYQR
ncbi:YbhB/YbcL family Raf kinase inhibitor-like protein [Actinomyces minihominis]|uniref:YbhB/YbcL family Raf kinase inhibitor-like protein n=1 Tax=Actinomyces minihominis TaxID=2002838 RepID=UPI000C07364A|nr:YbhB/YbcL family Raf kinase inhibitor-like protein [Actinomyces minihominis]